MSLTRKLQKIFGLSLTPTGNIGNYGSLAAGTPAFSNDPDAIQTAAWLNGLAAALVGNRSMALEDFNGVMFVLTRQLAYLLQAGVSEWISTETYGVNQFARVGGSLYVSLTDPNTGNNPVTDATNWIPFTSQMKGPTVARAWVVFDGINSTGGNANVLSSFNVDHVVRNADGSYTVVFATAMPSANYAPAGFCGSQDGNPFGAGDNATVVGNVTGQGNAIRSTASCRIFTINPSTLALVAPGVVSATFFG